MKDAKEVGPLTNLKLNKEGLADAADLMAELERRDAIETGAVIAQRVHLPGERIEAATAFWKKIYYSITAEGRTLNGVEAYDLGDDKMQDHPEKVIYIAMCNLMAIDAIRIMGDTWPTIDDAMYLFKGTERERDLADFWKKNYAPTLFQAKWAWAAALGVMAGNPAAMNEILYNFKLQLPDT